LQQYFFMAERPSEAQGERLHILIRIAEEIDRKKTLQFATAKSDRFEQVPFNFKAEMAVLLSSLQTIDEVTADEIDFFEMCDLLSKLTGIKKGEVEPFSTYIGRLISNLVADTRDQVDKVVDGAPRTAAEIRGVPVGATLPADRSSVGLFPTISKTTPPAPARPVATSSVHAIRIPTPPAPTRPIAAPGPVHATLSRPNLSGRVAVNVGGTIVYVTRREVAGGKISTPPAPAKAIQPPIAPAAAGPDTSTAPTPARPTSAPSVTTRSNVPRPANSPANGIINRKALTAFLVDDGDEPPAPNVSPREVRRSDTIDRSREALAAAILRAPRMEEK
jgi:hypothetical protein